MTRSSDPRRVLLLAHTGRADAREVARAFCKALTGHGIAVRLLADEAADLELRASDVRPAGRVRRGRAPTPAHGCELALVIGGDGTILRAAEITHASGTPAARASTSATSGSSPRPSTTTSSPRSTRSCTGATPPRTAPPSRCRCYRDGEVVWSSFALNEASVEKAARERMLEVVRRDRRPAAVPLGLRRRRVRDADRLDGLQLLRRRPDRVAGRRGADGGADQRARAVRPADGGGADVRGGGRGAGPHRGVRRAVVRRPAHRRPAARAPGSRYAAGRPPVRLVRLHEAPFTDRLVAKFGLPVEGWRGSTRAAPARGGDAAMLEEIRIGSLGRDRLLDARARARA